MNILFHTYEIYSLDHKKEKSVYVVFAKHKIKANKTRVLI